MAHLLSIVPGIPLTDPKYFATITKEQLIHILRSDSDYPIPLLDQRLDVIREAGKVLMEKYGGNFANVIAMCEKSAQNLLKIVVNDFSSYRYGAGLAGPSVVKIYMLYKGLVIRLFCKA